MGHFHERAFPDIPLESLGYLSHRRHHYYHQHHHHHHLWFTMDLARGCVDASCPDCWKEGCGLDGAFGQCADCLEAVNPCMEYFADSIWILGSPLAFPCIFFFSPDPENQDQSQGPGGGWQITMMSAPCKKPLTCCFATACPWCAQWMARYRALGGDMTKYKLWQGYHDGPQVRTACTAYNR